MAYAIEGRLLEACSCGGPCPCWVGEDPDGGSCEGMLGYHYDRGKINDIDVSGLTLALLAHIPGNILKGNWKVVAYVDSKATPEQKDAILHLKYNSLYNEMEHAIDKCEDLMNSIEAIMLKNA